jgi:6-phosphogluconolactonase
MRFLPVVLALAMTHLASAASARFYIGTYTGEDASRGIYTATLDTETGTISPPELAGEADNPSYLALAPDGRTLYAASESGESVVGAFSVGDAGQLTRLNDQPTGGTGACFVSVHPSGKWVFAADYGSGSIAAFPVNADGSLGERTGFAQFEGSGPNPKRQQAPHAHSIYPTPGDSVVACDLGTDQIRRFRLTAEGELIAEAPATVPPGSGPRHLALSPDGTLAVVANELGLSLSTFDVDPATGKFTPRATIPTHPAPDEKVTLAAVKFDPSGNFFSVSSRGDNELITYRRSPGGDVEEVGTVPARVDGPRDFAYDPSGRWLVAAGQNDDVLAVFAVDPLTGQLTPTDHGATISKPVCVIFAAD